MLRKFLPKQDQFFLFFNQTAELIEIAASNLSALLTHLDNPHPHALEINKNEKEGNHIAHQTFVLLHKSFITPFDRHDIHALTTALDDILDLINRIAQRFTIYELHTMPIDMNSLANLIMQAATLLRRAILALSNLSESKLIVKCCEQIDELKDQSHVLFLLAEKNLFSTESDFKTFYKLKEIYTEGKLLMSHYHDAANIITGIVLEYS